MMYFGFDAVTVAYGQRTVLRALTLALSPGEIVALIGPNGCGKSTLLKTVPRVLCPASGHVIYRDKPLLSFPPRQAAQKIAYLPQFHTAPGDLPLRTLVAYGRYPHRPTGNLTLADETIVDETIARVGLSALADRPLSTLSGGERQRAWIAMAVCQQPEILLLDEPTTYLDVGYQLEILELVRRLQEELNMTVLMVLHDLNLAARYADRLCVMRNGQIFADGTPDNVLTPDILHAVFGISAAVHRDETHHCPYFIPFIFKTNEETR